MAQLNVGFLHPGTMGISLAASAQNAGHTVHWVSTGRSRETQERAEKHALLDAQTLDALVDRCDVIISICPPDAAEEVAGQILATSFRGLYVDANAISPQRVNHIGQLMTDAGISFVDGAVIGGPAWEPGRTWLHLSGREAYRVATCFSVGPLETSIIGESIGKASALKMCYAAYSKGTTALLCAILAAAEALDVSEELEMQWSRHGSDFAQQTNERVRRVTAKAWRFAGEMEEIAGTFEMAGVPGEFHLAAADIFRRIAHFKETEMPPLADVLAALLGTSKKGADTK